MNTTKKITQTDNEVLAIDDAVDVMPGSSARPAAGETFENVLVRAVSRRAVLKGTGYVGASMVVAPALLTPELAKADDREADSSQRQLRYRDPGKRLTFQTIEPGNEPDVVVPQDYKKYVILRWGDPLFPGAPAFDVNNQTGAAQAQQFGFNADLVLFYPVALFRPPKREAQRQARRLYQQSSG